MKNAKIMLINASWQIRPHKHCPSTYTDSVTTVQLFETCIYFSNFKVELLVVNSSVTIINSSIRLYNCLSPCRPGLVPT